jgi:predicted ATPase
MEPQRRAAVATSREPLGVAGERVVLVQPLAPVDAERLFVTRLGEQGGAFGGADVDAMAVADLCARLDGLPLAIELAAARARTMSIVDLSERLTERLRLLGAGRGRAGRNQILQATVAWSYDLLDLDDSCARRPRSSSAGLTFAAPRASQPTNESTRLTLTTS